MSGEFGATVATQVYEVVGDLAGLAVVLVTAAVATLLAVRWDPRDRGAGHPRRAGRSGAHRGRAEAGTVAIIFVALASAAGVLVWKRWDWLALAAFMLAMPQWSAFLLLSDPGVPAILVTLTAFGGLGIVVAVGHDLRVRSDAVPWHRRSCSD